LIKSLSSPYVLIILIFIGATRQKSTVSQFGPRPPLFNLNSATPRRQSFVRISRVLFHTPFVPTCHACPPFHPIGKTRIVWTSGFAVHSKGSFVDRRVVRCTLLYSVDNLDNLKRQGQREGRGGKAGVDEGPRLERSGNGGGPRTPDPKASEEPEWCPAKRVKHTRVWAARRAPTEAE